ncbi:protein translocase subunit SecA-like [Trematomus bernacchii]|uniref:protein translocase subunit SecA-like n=1 Tax=Trematomus bernacchii TaxID=40690 RepID=UPI00146DCE51|nr:protein translocase subunit SecA-like [Trematomus bernacchii]
MSESDSSDEELVEILFPTLIAFSLVSPKIILNKLQGFVRNIQWSTKDVTELFKALLERFESTTQDRSHLFSWMLNMLQCIEINYITPGWKSQTGKTLIQLVRDKSVTDEHLKKNVADAPEKSLDEILEEIRQQKLNHIDDNLLKDVRDIVSAVDEDLTSPSDGSQRNDLKKVLLNLCRAVEESLKFRPRLTQMVSWCIMALSKTGQLIQVGTGEGKSCIIAMFAAFRALKGEEVDIFTSSPVLAERDFLEWKGFYDVLKIRVNCNTNKQVEHLKECYECNVVYGTAEAFAGHWLGKRFERIDTFEQRKIQCAIVDEVDSLMLDKGNHFVYIASDMPALQHLNPLLAFIWTTAKKYSNGFCHYIYSDTESKVRAAEEEIKHALHFTPCELNEDRIACYVPGFLADLVNSKLKVWIENAFKAQTMTEDREYTLEKHGIVPVDYSSTGVVENFRVMPDGLQQFLEMKHKYKLSDMTAITNYMSNVGLFMKYKDQIFGISGTLGQQAETDTLEKIYDVKTCQIPAFKRRKLFEVEGVIVSDEEEWIEEICNVVLAETNPTPYRAQRAVLVICETIQQAKDLDLALKNKVPDKKLYTSNNIDNTAIFKKKLEAGEVIIATNLAGRGMDLQVSDQVKRAGGLFVLQTFLPVNARVEAQAFGRTARQGSPGSAQLIICSSPLPEPLKLLALMGELQTLMENVTNVLPLCFSMQLRSYQESPSYEQANEMSSTLTHILTENSNSPIKTVKEVRDDLVAKELASFSECEIPNIKKKESLFKQYLDTLDKEYQISNNKPAASDVSALNEFWGIWLLTNFNENESTSNLENKLGEDLETARQKLRRRESPSSNLHHYTAFGNELRKRGQLADSIMMYTKAIQEDHCWAAIAYYNRAFASLSQQERQQDPNCIDQALEDLQNALKSVELHCEQIKFTYIYSKDIMDLCSDSVDRFDSHMSTRHLVLQCFKSNINEAIKKLERAKLFGSTVKLEESLLHFMVPAVHLLPWVVLSTQSLPLIRSGDPLKLYQLISHRDYDIHIELMRLQNLGLTHVYTLDTMFSLGGFFSKILRL